MQRSSSRPSCSASVHDGLGLRRTVQQVAHQGAGVDAVHVLGARAQGAGEPQATRDGARDLDRRRGDQPDPLPLVEVHLRQCPGAGPDPAGHGLVEDLLAEGLELLHPVPLDEGEGGAAGVGDVLRVLHAHDAEVRLLPRRAQDLAGAEELAPVQASGEVEDRGALDDRVVDVEEGGRGRVGGCLEGGLELAGGRRGLPGEGGSQGEIGGGGSPGRRPSAVAHAARVVPPV